jgi:CheY-like chemotaxis protein
MIEQQSCDVLIVDDDDAIRHALTLLLEQSGYVVKGAHNGEKALDVLRATDKLPSVILLDLNMPIMTGWEFRLEQKRDSQLAQIPVIIISADRSLEHQPFTIDAIGYFRKPLDIPELLRLIAQHCGDLANEA